jgi:hypothetical protein
MTATERTKHLYATKPDMAAFNMGSMNYAIFQKKQSNFSGMVFLKIHLTQ